MGKALNISVFLTGDSKMLSNWHVISALPTMALIIDDIPSELISSSEQSEKTLPTYIFRSTSITPLSDVFASGLSASNVSGISASGVSGLHVSGVTDLPDISESGLLVSGVSTVSTPDISRVSVSDLLSDLYLIYL